MTRHDRRARLLAAAMAALAGYVDAIGFVQLGGLFVSFMSGNTTRLAVGAVLHAGIAATAAALILAFLAGVVGGSTLATWGRARRKTYVLLLVAALLALAAGLDAIAPARVSALILAGAMGAANCVFQRGGEVTIGVSYMTGTLVKLGQGIATALLGGPPLRWLPYLLLWSALLGGAVAGAWLYPLLGPRALLLAAAVSALLALLAPAADEEIDRQA